VSAAPADRFRYCAFSRGDWNGFFALAVDNLAMLFAMAGILVGAFRMPAEVVLGRMVPGTALGVLVGDFAYAWLAWRLARRERRQDVCAMPLGIDTPSLFALTFGVVGPVFATTGDAGRAWSVGMAVMVIMGVAKIGAAFAGEALRRALPRTALLAALAGVAVALILYFPFVKIAAEPIGGFVALGVVLITLVGRIRLPREVPVVVVSVVAGLAAWWIARRFGYEPPPLPPGEAAVGLAMPWPSLLFADGLAIAIGYAPLALPVALATVVGGIDNTESAAAAGDRYRTRDILLVEGAATLVAGVCGGVIQTTPYIGHPAYKSMGCRAGYVIATGLALGVGAATGAVGALIAVLPESVIVPILVFVGLEMAEQATATAEPKHLKAVAIAVVPVLANLVSIQTGLVLAGAGVDVSKLPADLGRTLLATTMLGNGFIVTSMLWSAWTVDVVDGRHGRAALIAATGAVSALFGLVHSPFADGRWFVPGGAGVPAAAYAFATGYALLAGVTWLAGRWRAYASR
jgi:AGZA family xanthine/uracil permease-like MFS transporter